jgi:hypothetical protein
MALIGLHVQAQAYSACSKRPNTYCDWEKPARCLEPALPRPVVRRMQAVATLLTCMLVDRKFPTEDHASEACFVRRMSRHA